MGIRRKEEKIASGIESGVGPKFDAGCFLEACEEGRVAADEVWGAFVEADDAVGFERQEVREGDAKNFVGIVAVAANFGGAGEVYQDVFVD